MTEVAGRNWKYVPTAGGYVCTADCPECQKNVRVVGRCSSSSPGACKMADGKFEYSGWGGGLNEYYCKECGIFIVRFDHRSWHGQETCPPREQDYGPARLP